MQHEERYTELIGRYLAGELSDQEQEQLMNWVNAAPEHRMLFEELTTIWNSAETTEAPAPEGADDVWNAIEEKLEPKGMRKIGGAHKNYRWFRMAAAILLLLGAVFWLNSDFFYSKEEIAVLQTGPDENKQYELPDGSTILLNERTKLTYVKSFEQRHVTLEGEAFFEVAKKEGAEFTVVSGPTETVVLGTAFNVRAYPQEDRVEVTVAHGKVAFKEKKSDQQQLLEKGKRAVYEKKEKIMRTEANTDQNVMAWKSKRFLFDDTPVGQVIETLERYYHIRIEVENPAILNCTFNGEFVDPELKPLLETLSFGLNLTVEENGKNYVFSGAGCN